MKKLITAKKNQKTLTKTKGKQIREVAAKQRLTKNDEIDAEKLARRGAALDRPPPFPTPCQP